MKLPHILTHIVVAICMAGFAALPFGMPQDSTAFVRILPSDFPQANADVGQFTPTQRVVPGLAGVITDYQATIYSNPNANGEIDVDMVNRISGCESTGKRDRGGDAYISSSFNVYLSGGYFPNPAGAKGPDGTDCVGRGRFNDALNPAYRSTGQPRGWTKISYLPVSSTSTTTLSQPYAIKESLIPLGKFHPVGQPFPAFTIPLADLGITPNRVVYFQTLHISDPDGNGSSVYENFNASRGGKTGVAASISGSRKAIVFDRNTFRSPGNPSSLIDTSYERNRGYFLAQYLAAECNDGAGIFTATNVGARTVSAHVGTPPSLVSSYSGCHGHFNGTYVIENTGDNIWTEGTTYDKFRFAHKGYSGNRNFICRVDQLENTNSWARAGIMMRTGTGTGDIGIGIFVTPGNGIISQFRSSPNGTYNNPPSIVSSIKAPIWLRLHYENGVTKTYQSTDTANWGNPIATYNRNFSGTYQAGLAAAGRSNVPNTSVYSNLKGF